MTHLTDTVAVAATIVGIACLVAMVVLLLMSVRENRLARRDHAAFLRELDKLLQR